MLTSERIEEIQSRSRADYACLDAPGFRDSLAARRDVAALLSDRAELVAEIDRLRGQCVRREAMYAGMTAERDGYWEECDSLKAEIERLREVMRRCQEYIGTGNATVDYEAAAEKFRRDTHMMAPGKSEPSGFVSRYTYDQRRMAWEAWCEQRRADVILALAALEARDADE